MMTHNTITWFELPARNLARAVKFYSAVFDQQIDTREYGGKKMGFFPNQGEGVSGAIVEHEDYTPSLNGILIYINAGEDLSTMLSRIEPAGGKVIVTKTLVGEGLGYYAIFLDPEDNRLALHSIS